MRLFIALKFNSEIENILTDIQNELKANNVTGNYTDCHNLHLTLAFIGEYNAPDKVIMALKRVSFDPFCISLEGNIGSFGDLYWVGIKRDHALMELDKKVRNALQDFNIPFDHKSFRPHITIIRKAGLYGKKEKQIKEICFKKGTMTVEKISLMKSDRNNGKLVYTEIGYLETKKENNNV